MVWFNYTTSSIFSPTISGPANSIWCDLYTNPKMETNFHVFDGTCLLTCGNPCDMMRGMCQSHFCCIENWKILRVYTVYLPGRINHQTLLPLIVMCEIKLYHGCGKRGCLSRKWTHLDLSLSWGCSPQVVNTWIEFTWFSSRIVTFVFWKRLWHSLSQTWFLTRSLIPWKIRKILLSAFVARSDMQSCRYAHTGAPCSCSFWLNP